MARDRLLLVTKFAEAYVIRGKFRGVWHNYKADALDWLAISRSIGTSESQVGYKGKSRYSQSTYATMKLPQTMLMYSTAMFEYIFAVQDYEFDLYKLQEGALSTFLRTWRKSV